MPFTLFPFLSEGSNLLSSLAHPFTRDRSLNRRTGLTRNTPLNARNPARLARLRAFQFGEDGKREWVMSLPCGLTGVRGSPDNPVDPAHVLGTRGAGAGPNGLFPLRRFPAHVDFDSSMTEVTFRAKYGRDRAWVRRQARQLEEMWRSRKVAGGQRPER